MEKICGIYEIRSLCKPEKIYVGSSVDIYRRWRGHKCRFGKNIHANKKLQNHYNKYGAGDFVYIISIICSVDELPLMEQHMIDKLKPQFNIIQSVEKSGTLGYHHTKEAKAKIGQASKNRHGCWHGHHQPPEMIEKRASKMRGKTLSPSHVKNISERMMGNKYGLGRIMSPEEKDFLRKINGTLVINIETGIFYESIKEAAESAGMDRHGLSHRLTGKIKNKTMFRYA